LWCHNPESKHPGPELGFDAEKCVGCDTCLGTCHREALNRESPLFVDRSRCDLCFECTEQCPSGALHRIGSEMSLDQMVRSVVKDKPFFDNSGGGVTISGGEPTMYMDFLSELVAALKAGKVRVLIETCGLFSLDRFWDTRTDWSANRLGVTGFLRAGRGGMFYLRTWYVAFDSARLPVLERWPHLTNPEAPAGWPGETRTVGLGRPELGAVGQFQARTTLDRDTVPLGDAALLRLRVEGTGNLKWIDRPPAESYIDAFLI